MPFPQKLKGSGQPWGSADRQLWGGFPLLNPEIPFSPAQVVTSLVLEVPKKKPLRRGSLNVWDLAQGIRGEKVGINVLP